MTADFIEVVAAIIESKGKLLAFQRGLSPYDYISYKFEFPGGKIKKGEDQRLALARELREELNLNVQIDQHVGSIEHTYPDFKIKMHCYLVHIDQFDGRLMEHESFEHVNLTEAEELNWVEADRPILNILRKEFSHVFKK